MAIWPWPVAASRNAAGSRAGSIGPPGTPMPSRHEASSRSTSAHPAAPRRHPLFDRGLGRGTLLHESPHPGQRQQGAWQHGRQHEDADKAAANAPTREWTGLSLMTEDPLIARVTSTTDDGGS